MTKLNRGMLSVGFPEDLRVGVTKPLTEKVLQFGEGNFLRAFVDYMIDELNAAGKFDGGVVVAQPIAKGMADMLNEQDGLYTVILRGLVDGEEVCVKRVVTSVTRGLNPYEAYDDYAQLAKSPDLRFVVSNTTEAGIVHMPEGKVAGKPQDTFPAKVCAFLFDRFTAFGGDAAKGLVFIPCELIDENGTTLKRCVLQYAEDWQLGKDFIGWVNNANYFTNTLVDRIVTGYPAAEAEALWEELGYRDDLLDTAEIFHYWVIEYPKGAEGLAKELPFKEIGLNVKWTDDVTPYKARKVRILNGAHTASVLAAYLAGHDAVGDMMNDKAFVDFLRKLLFDEVIPGLTQYLPYDNLKAFADSVFDRFGNPFIKHNIMSIALNSASKFRARVLPSILAYTEENGAPPKRLAFALAALTAFYRVSKEGDAYTARRDGGEYKVQDEERALKFFEGVWQGKGDGEADLSAVATAVCASEMLWGRDLTGLPGFRDAVAKDLFNIVNHGAKEAMRQL